MKRAKITIIGAGNVGATTAHWCAAAGLGDIVLWTSRKPRACPRARHWTCSRPRPIVGFDAQVAGTTHYDDTAGSDVVVITAGVPRKPGMSRDDLLATNARIVGDVAEQIKRTSPQAVVIVVSNPLDAMVQRALQVTGFPPQRGDGSGRRARYGPLPRLPGRRVGHQPGRHLGHAPGRPRRHDGAAAELHVRGRHPGRRN